MYSTIEVSVANGVGRLTLARPAQKNAINGQMCRELAEAAASLVADPAVKVIVLSGQGDAFCVGGDFVEFVAQGERLPELLREMTTPFHAAILSLRRAAAPLVVAVNGVAAGGGFSLVLGADLAIAKRSARLVSAYTRSGLTPDGGGTWLLERLVGPQRAFDLMATNPTLSADQALAMGLVSRVVDDGELEAEIEKVCVALLSLPSGAAGRLKRLLAAVPERSLEAQMSAEAKSLAEAASEPETRASLEAFLAKKKVAR